MEALLGPRNPDSRFSVRQVEFFGHVGRVAVHRPELPVGLGEIDGFLLGALERLVQRLDVLAEVLGEGVVLAVLLDGALVEESTDRDAAPVSVLEDGVLILVDDLPGEQRRAEVVGRDAELGSDGFEDRERYVAVFEKPRRDVMGSHWLCWVVVGDGLLLWREGELQFLVDKSMNQAAEDDI